jgi:hypothetical protein
MITDHPSRSSVAFVSAMSSYTPTCLENSLKLALSFHERVPIWLPPWIHHQCSRSSAHRDLSDELCNPYGFAGLKKRTAL